MDNTKESNFRLGQLLALSGIRYTKIPSEVLTLTGSKTVNSSIFMGFDETNRITRCGYSNLYWSKSGDSYKTSSDISTLF